MKLICLSIFSLLVITSGSGQVDSSNHVTGNVLYEQGNYLDAIKVYELVIRENGYSAEVNFNLGNCYYKTGNMGKCILNYERALQLDPGDGDIKYNLDLANLRIRDKIGVVDELILAIWWRNIMDLFTTNTWAVISVLLMWLSLTGLAAFRLSNKMNLQKAGFFSFAICLLLMLFTLIITFSSDQYNRTHQYAIIMDPSAILKSEPNESSTNLSLLHEGLKIQLLQEEGDWVEIKMSDGYVGWLSRTSVEKI